MRYVQQVDVNVPNEQAHNELYLSLLFNLSLTLTSLFAYHTHTHTSVHTLSNIRSLCFTNSAAM